jgi:hypothetical protein
MSTDSEGVSRRELGISSIPAIHHTWGTSTPPGWTHKPAPAPKLGTKSRKHKGGWHDLDDYADIKLVPPRNGGQGTCPSPTADHIIEGILAGPSGMSASAWAVLATHYYSEEGTGHALMMEVMKRLTGMGPEGAAKFKDFLRLFLQISDRHTAATGNN